MESVIVITRLKFVVYDISLKAFVSKQYSDAIFNEKITNTFPRSQWFENFALHSKTFF
jgi:hypothetical protein